MALIARFPSVGAGGVLYSGPWAACMEGIETRPLWIDA